MLTRLCTATLVVIATILTGCKFGNASLMSLSANQISQLLDSWSLGNAFKSCFQTLGVTGDMLQHDFLSAADIDLSLCVNAMPAHANKLIRKLDDYKKEYTAIQRRKLQQADSSAASGIAIKSDEAYIIMGAEGDVVMSRTDTGLKITNNVTVDGNLIVDGNDILSPTSSDWHVFVGEEPITLRRNIPVSQTFTTSADYELTFEINPFDIISDWGNIMHFTMTGDNCCDYGSRIPAVWFYADTSCLLVAAGTNESGSATWNGRDEPLPMHSWTTVNIVAEGDDAKVYYNDTYVGRVQTDERMPHDDVTVWMSDDWHNAASVQLRNVRYRRIAYHHPGFYNGYTQHDFEISTQSRVADLEDRVAALEAALE